MQLLNLKKKTPHGGRVYLLMISCSFPPNYCPSKRQCITQKILELKGISHTQQDAASVSNRMHA